MCVSSAQNQVDGVRQFMIGHILYGVITAGKPGRSTNALIPNVSVQENNSGFPHTICYYRENDIG